MISKRDKEERVKVREVKDLMGFGTVARKLRKVPFEGGPTGGQVRQKQATRQSGIGAMLTLHPLPLSSHSSHDFSAKLPVLF